MEGPPWQWLDLLSPQGMPAGPSSSSSSQKCVSWPTPAAGPTGVFLHGPGGQGSAVEVWHWIFSANPSALRNSHDGVTPLIIPAEGLTELGLEWCSCAAEGGQPHSGGHFLSDPSSPTVPSLIYQPSSKPPAHVHLRGVLESELPPSGTNNFCFLFAENRACLCVWPFSPGTAAVLCGSVCTAACRDLPGKGRLSAWNSGSASPASGSVCWGRGGCGPGQGWAPRAVSGCSLLDQH